MTLNNEKGIYKAMNEALKSIAPVGKDSMNEVQRFKFRGIDATIQAVNPALAGYGIIVTADVIDYKHYAGQTSKGAATNNVVVKMEYTFHALDGSFLQVSTIGEAMDMGDKAFTKAQSVALRICLLNTFCIPTGDVDPDATSYERGAPIEQQTVIENPKPNKDEPRRSATKGAVRTLTADETTRLIEILGIIVETNEIDILRKYWDSEKDFLDVPIMGTTLKDALNVRAEFLK
jgi:hypothetical protein